MQPIVDVEVVADVHCRLIDVDGPRCRTAKSSHARRVNEICPWDPLDQLCNHRVGYGSALRVAQDQTIQVKLLSLAETFIRAEKECLVLEQRPPEIPAELIALEWRWVG